MVRVQVRPKLLLPEHSAAAAGTANGNGRLARAGAEAGAAVAGAVGAATTGAGPTSVSGDGGGSDIFVVSAVERSPSTTIEAVAAADAAVAVAANGTVTESSAGNSGRPSEVSRKGRDTAARTGGGGGDSGTGVANEEEAVGCEGGGQGDSLEDIQSRLQQVC